jgi:hypothetical protein
MHKGACLCGEVKLQVFGTLEHNDACHCTKCRKWTGHYYAGADIKRSDLKIIGEENITWFNSSSNVRRGFCSKCGSSLFFDPIDNIKHDWIGVSLGVFDSPTESKLRKHIFTADKGDYYDLNDGVHQE